MGVVNLMNFIKKKFPSVINDRSPLHYKNKTLAIDSPSTIYKFLVKTITSSSTKLNIPVDSQGNQTGHLIGIMYRALLCMEIGIKPIWVFDGTPPAQKLTQLRRRKSLKQQAQSKKQQALIFGDFLQAAKQSQRSVRISKEEIQDTIKMLTFMGMPTVRSYGQAEAQCAWLTKNGFADGVVSEDLDTLAFGATRLIRQFSRDKPCTQISIAQVLQQMKMTQQQFIDFCILCGCDYTTKISQIGPVKAYDFINKYGSIEKTVQTIVNNDKLRTKHKIPDDFSFLRARQLFHNPNVNTEIKKQQLEQKQVDYDGLKSFLLSKDFDETRINKWIQVSKAALQKNPIK